MDLQDKFENLVIGDAGSAMWSVTIVFNGAIINTLEAIPISSNMGKLVATVPAQSANFSSVLTNPRVNTRLQYMIHLEASPDNALEPIFSHTFDIIHGPAKIAKLEQTISNTTACQALETQGSNPGILTILFMDEFGNRVQSLSQTFSIAITGPFGLVDAACTSNLCECSNTNQSFVNATAVNGILNIPKLTAAVMRSDVQFKSTLSAIVATAGLLESYTADSNIFSIVSGLPHKLVIIAPPIKSVSHEPMRGNPSVALVDMKNNRFSCPVHIRVHLVECTLSYCNMAHEGKFVIPQDDSVTGTIEILHDPVLGAVFTDIQVNLGTGGAGRSFSLKFEMCKYEAKQSRGCASGYDDSDISRQVNQCWEIPYQQNGLITAISPIFHVTVKTMLQLSQQPGSLLNIDNRISSSRRVLVDQTLGNIMVTIYGDDGTIVDISGSKIAVESVPTDSLALAGISIKSSVEGRVLFEGLKVDQPGSARTLRFFIIVPPLPALVVSPAPVFKISEPFNVEPLDVVHLKITQESGEARAGNVFGVQPVVELLDYDMALRADATFTVAAQLILFDPVVDRSNVLQGTMDETNSNQATVVAQGGVATFTNLRIDIATFGFVCPSDGTRFDSLEACQVHEACKGIHSVSCRAAAYMLRFEALGTNGYLPGSPDFTDAGNFSVAHGEVAVLKIGTEPGNMVSGFTMDQQPSVLLFDLYRNPALTVYQEGDFDDLVRIVVSLSGFNEGQTSQLTGTSILLPKAGAVQFTDLAVTGIVSEGYTLIFQIPESAAMVQSATFAVRKFSRMEVIISPQNPSYVDAFFRASIRATDEEGRLAPLTTLVNISLELPDSSSEPILLGNLTVHTKDGVADFFEAFINKQVLEEPGAVLTFSTEWPDIAKVSSDAFIVAPGPYHEFVFEVEPADFYVAYRTFDNSNSPCPEGFEARDGDLVQGCGPVLRLRSKQGILSHNQPGSVLVRYIQCKECAGPLSQECSCDYSLVWAPSVSCTGPDGGCCKALSTSNVLGRLSFPELMVETPDTGFYLMVSRFTDDLCLEPYADDTAFPATIFSDDFRVFSANYARLQLDVALCPEPGAIYVAGVPFDVQPFVTGVVDINDNRVVTRGNKVVVLMYMKAFGEEYGGCLEAPQAPQRHECYGFQGYPATDGELPFHPDEGFVNFTSLAASVSNGGNPDLSVRDREFFLRFYVRNWMCLGAICDYIGALTYADCPNGFYVTANIISQIEIQVQPGNSVAGSGLARFPIIILTDAYGNRREDVSAEDTWNVSVFLHAPDVPATPSTRINRQTNEPDVIEATVTVNADMVEFSKPELRTIIIVSQAAKGYTLEFLLHVEPEFRVLSSTFEVVPCAVAQVSMVHSQITVAAGDSICGARGSAWHEMAEVLDVLLYCKCEFSYPMSSYSFDNTADTTTCTTVCQDTFAGMNGSIAHLDLSGNPKEGVRNWEESFYVGSSIVFNSDVFPNGTVVLYDSSRSVFGVAWNAAINATVLRDALVVSHDVTILLNETNVADQAHRCVLAVTDSYGNLVDTGPLNASAQLFHYLYDVDQMGKRVNETITSAHDLLQGITVEQSVLGLVTFPEMYVTLAGEYELKFSIENTLQDNTQKTALVSSSHFLRVVHGLRNKITLISTSGITEGKVGNIVPILPMKLSISDAYDNVITNSSCLQISTQLSENLLISSNNWGLFLRPSGKPLSQLDACEAVPTIETGQTTYTTCDGISVDLVTAEFDAWPGPCSFAVDTVDGVAIFDNITTSLSASQSAYPLMLDFMSGCPKCRGQASVICEEPRLRKSSMSSLSPVPSPCVLKKSAIFGVLSYTEQIASAAPDLVYSAKVFTSSATLYGALAEQINVTRDTVKVQLQFRNCSTCDFELEDFDTGYCIGGLAHGSPCTRDDSIICQGEHADQALPSCEHKICIMGVCDPTRTKTPKAGKVDFTDLIIHRASGEASRLQSAYSKCTLSDSLNQKNNLACNGTELTGSLDYRLLFTLISNLSIVHASQPFTVTSPGPFHHLVIVSLPLDVTAGKVFSAIIAEIRDVYDNLLPSMMPQPKLNAVVSERTETLGLHQQCAGQVCQSDFDDSDNIFCANSPFSGGSGTPLQNCFQSCSQHPKCVAFTFYDPYPHCLSNSYGSQCHKAFQCYLAFESCSSATDQYAGTVHLIGFLNGTRTIQATAGVVLFEDLSFNKAGEIVFSICHLTAVGCRKRVDSPMLRVDPDELAHLVILNSNQSKKYHQSKNQYVPSSVVANEPFKLAVRLTDHLDNTVPANLYAGVGNVDVSIFRSQNRYEISLDLLKGKKDVESVQGIAEFTLVYTGGAGNYYLKFNITKGNGNVTTFSSVFHIDPAVAMLQFEAVESASVYAGNDILYPFPRVLLLDAIGNMVNNSVLNLRIEMLRTDETPPQIRVIGIFTAPPVDGPAIVEFQQVGIVGPSMVGGARQIEFRVSALPEHIEFADIPSVTKSFEVMFPGSQQIIQEELAPPAAAQRPLPIAVKAGEWFARSLNVLVRDETFEPRTITLSQRTVTARIQNLTRCNIYSRFCTNALGGNLSGITEVSAVNGIATFTQLRIFFSGQFTLIFESSIFGEGFLQVSQHTPVSVGSSAYSGLSLFQQPSGSWKSGDQLTIPPVVLAMDRYSNIIADGSAQGNVVETVMGDQDLPRGPECWSFKSITEAPTSNRSPPKPCAQLFRATSPTQSVGSISVALEKGVARFTCLAITRQGSAFTFRFTDLTSQPRLWVESSHFGAYASDPSFLVVTAEPSQQFLMSAGQNFSALGVPSIAVKDRHGKNAKMNESSVVYATMSLDPSFQVLDLTFFDFQRVDAVLIGTAIAPVKDLTAEFPDASVDRAMISARLRFESMGIIVLSNYFSVVHAPNVASIVSYVSPGESLQGEYISPAPSVALLDKFNNTVNSIEFAVFASLALENGPSKCDTNNTECDMPAVCLELMGTTRVTSKNGIAVFAQIQLGSPPGKYKLRYDLGPAQSWSDYRGNLLPDPDAAVIPHFSKRFVVHEKPSRLIVFPASWHHCADIRSESECSELCKWVPSLYGAMQRCVGLEDAVAGDFFLQQPTVTLVNSGGNVTSLPGKHLMRVSLFESVDEMSEFPLSEFLTGTLQIEIFNGTAAFTDLTIHREGQGYVLKFEVAESCCSQSGATLGGLTVLSSPINVFAPVAIIAILKPPKDAVIGDMNASDTDVVIEVRNRFNSRSIYASGIAHVKNDGGVSPRCPASTKTLHVAPDQVYSTFYKYSMAITDAFRSDPTMWVEGINTIDRQEFMLLLENELDVTAITADKMKLFTSFDVRGGVDAYGLDVPDGALTLKEFSEAAELCVCAPGTALGKVTLAPNALKHEFDLSMMDRCQPYKVCANGYLGIDCRKANYQLLRSLPRRSTLTGTTSVPIVYGRATFTDLGYLESVTRLRLTFETHGFSATSHNFTVGPGIPSRAIFLSPPNMSEARAGANSQLSVVLVDKWDNVNMRGMATVALEHLNVLRFSSDCRLSSDILPCSSCPDNACPGPKCPFRCSYTNAIRPTSHADATPWGQPCSYNCQQGCSFMCGTMLPLPMSSELGGQLSFSDLRIKRVGRHSFRTIIANASTDFSVDTDQVARAQIQKRVLGRLLTTETAVANEIELIVTPDQGNYLASDYGPIKQILEHNTSRAGSEIYPYPACIIMDQYGNRVTNEKRRIGLIIRDSDRDDFSVLRAVEKFVSDPKLSNEGTPTGINGWPSGTGDPLSAFVSQDFGYMPDHDLHTGDDFGCAPMGAPEGGCPVIDMEQDRAISPEWCPSNQEKRHCYGCLTAERFFESYNRTHWKQTYEFVNNSVPIGKTQPRGAADCPDSHKICPDGGTNCACLIEIKPVHSNLFDLCEACSTRMMPMGMPVVDAVNGRAVFSGMTCSKPRKGYRFQCVSPAGLQDSDIVAPNGDVGNWVHSRLRGVEWDLKNARNPPLSFGNQNAWGPYNPSMMHLWEDRAGNAHPTETACVQLCQNNTLVTSPHQLDTGVLINLKRYYIKHTCPSRCWKYSFPILLNSLFPYVLPESPALSLAVTVSAGDVHRLLMQPIPGILVVQQDVTIAGPSTPVHAGQVSFLSQKCATLRFASEANGVYSACLQDTRFFEMVDQYGNNNRTSEGQAYTTLYPSADNAGAEVTGIVEVPLSYGRASFDTLRISCAGTEMQLKFSYLRYPDRGLALLDDPTVIVGYSPIFTVLPPPPRIAGVYFGDGHTSLWVVFDKDTDRGNDLLVSKCRIIDSVDLFDNSVFEWTNVPTPKRELGDLSMWPLGKIEECSWLDSRTLVVSLGIGASILPGDRLRLRTIADNIKIRSSLEVQNGMTALVSLPSDIASKSCAGNNCGGHTINDFHALIEEKLSCPVAIPDGEECMTSFKDRGGPSQQIPATSNVRDIESMFFGGSTWFVLGLFCQYSTSKLHCGSYSTKSQLYKLKRWQDGTNSGTGVFFQHEIDTVGVVDVESISLIYDVVAAPAYFAVAQHFNGISNALSVDIYAWNGDEGEGKFEIVQIIPTFGAVGIKSQNYGSSSFLLIAQLDQPVHLLEWEPEKLIQVGTVYVKQPGRYIPHGTLVNSGEASNLRSYITKNRWIVAVSNFRSRDQPCHATSCGDVQNRTYRSSVDLFELGGSLTVDNFITYPDHQGVDKCIKEVWALSSQIANITFQELAGPVALLLQHGTYVKINDEIMRIVDANSEDIGGRLALLDANDALDAFEKMDRNHDGILDLVRETSIFVTPQDYRPAWSALSNNHERIKTFTSLLGNITGQDFKRTVSSTSVDVDGDGDSDLVVGTQNGSLRVLLNNGHGFFSEVFASSFEGSDMADTAKTVRSVFSIRPLSRYLAPSFVDLNSDGRLDLVLGSADGSLRAYLSKASNTSTASDNESISNTSVLNSEFWPVTASNDPFVNITTSAFSKPIFADVDADGLPDLLLGGLDGSIKVFLQENMSSIATSFSRYGRTAAIAMSVPGGDTHAVPTVLDYNGDGMQDVLVGSNNGLAYAFVMTATNPIAFAEGVQLKNFSVFGSSSPCVLDYNNDGVIDIIIGHSFGDFLVFLQNTSAPDPMTFSPMTSTPLYKEAIVITKSDYLKVFTGFRCSRGKCKNCKTSRVECGSTACHGINPDYTSKNGSSLLSNNCQEYFISDVDPVVGSCCRSAGAQLAPCRRNGHITVLRRQLGTRSPSNGICRYDDPSTQEILLCADIIGERVYGCSCRGGTEQYKSCTVDLDCKSHKPGTSLFILPSSLALHGQTPLVQLPSLGAKDAELFEIGDEHFVAVANHFSGCGARGFEQDSFLYKVDLSSGQYTLHQRLLTQGSHGIATLKEITFDLVGNMQTSTYLLFASLRAQHSLLAHSSVYKWTQSPTGEPVVNCSSLGGIEVQDGLVCCPSRCGPTCGNSTSCQGSCCIHNIVLQSCEMAEVPCTCAIRGRCRSNPVRSVGQLELVADLVTSSAVGWTVFESDVPSGIKQTYLMPVSSSAVHQLPSASKLYNLKSPKPSPIIIVNRPSDIGPCGDLALDAQSSFGSAGRPFTKVQWTLLDGPTGKDRDLANIISGTKSLVLNIPFDQASAGKDSPGPYFPSGLYSIQLTLVNWLGQTSSYNAVVNKSNAGEIETSVLFPFTSWPRNAAFLIEGAASTDSIAECGARTNSPWNVQWSWSIMPLPSSAFDIVATNKNLQVPEYALREGVEYTFTLTASAYGFSGSASIRVKIAAARPLAIVEGGNRIISTGVGETSDIILDASQSRNPNFGSFELASYLTIVIRWTCSYRNNWSEIDSRVCPPDWFSNNKIKLVFRRSRLPVGMVNTVFSFVLNVESFETGCVLKSTVMGGVGSLGNCVKYTDVVGYDQAAVEIHTTTTPNIPRVTLAVTSGKKTDVEPTQNEAPARTIVTVTVSSALVISGTIISSTPITSIRWSLRDSVPLECVDNEWCAPGNLLSPQCPTDGGTLESSASICRNDDPIEAMDCSTGCGDTLIVEKNAFLGPGGSGVLGVRTFDLHVTDVNGHIGLAFVHILIDHGPDFGDLSVSPQVGFAVSTRFDAAATQWTDRPPGDSVFSPMSYLWSIREEGCGSANCEVVLTEQSWISSINTQLPMGVWTFGVYVKDAISTEYLMLSASSVTVDPIPFNSTSARRETTRRAGHATCTLEYLAQMNAQLLKQSQDSKDEYIVILNGARTVNWCHRELALSSANPDLEWTASAIQIRSLLVTLIGRVWTQGSGKSQSPPVTLQASELLLEALSITTELDLNTLTAASALLSDIVHSIIDVFRKRTASLPAYPTDPGLLDSKSPPDIPQANILAAKAVGVINSLLQSNQLLSAAGRRRGLKSGYQQALSINKVIQEVSAVSVCNVFAGQTAFYSSSHLEISTAFVSNQNLAGFGLVSETESWLSSPCHKARDPSSCCVRSAGACCFGAACEVRWPAPRWVDGPASLIMPEVPAQRDAFAYEVQLAQSKGNAFDNAPLLSSSTLFVVVRKADTELTLAPGPPGIKTQERILRMPISKTSYDRAVVDSVNTPEKPGRIPACVVWDEGVKDWVKSDIRQSSGLSPLSKMCVRNITAPDDLTAVTPCFYTLECFTTRSEGIFAVIQAIMDCKGIPLGNAKFDACDVCSGDNSTCSGCDNMPNTISDGVSMTKDCSGHGQCDGLMCRCVCVCF